MKTPYRDGKAIPAKVAKGVAIEMGAMVALNEFGYAVPADDDGATAVLGCAESTVDNSDGDNGDVYVVVARKRQFLLQNDGDNPLTQADFGKMVYVTSNNSVALAGKCPVGVLAGIEADGTVWVGIGEPAIISEPVFEPLPA